MALSRLMQFERMARDPMSWIRGAGSKLGVKESGKRPLCGSSKAPDARDAQALPQLARANGILMRHTAHQSVRNEPNERAHKESPAASDRRIDVFDLKHILGRHRTKTIIAPRSNCAGCNR